MAVVGGTLVHLCWTASSSFERLAANSTTSEAREARRTIRRDIGVTAIIWFHVYGIVVPFLAFDSETACYLLGCTALFSLLGAHVATTEPRSFIRPALFLFVPVFVATCMPPEVLERRDRATTRHAAWWTFVGMLASPVVWAIVGELREKLRRVPADGARRSPMGSGSATAAGRVGDVPPDDENAGAGLG